VKRNSSKNNKETGETYVDAGFLRKELDRLDYALETGKYKDRKDWFDLLRDPEVKREDVEHRQHEQHHNELADYYNSFSTGGGLTMKYIDEGDERPPPKSKPEDGGEKNKGDELDEAKFEPSYDN